MKSKLSDFLLILFILCSVEIISKKIHAYRRKQYVPEWRSDSTAIQDFEDTAVLKVKCLNTCGCYGEYVDFSGWDMISVQHCKLICGCGNKISIGEYSVVFPPLDPIVHCTNGDTCKYIECKSAQSIQECRRWCGACGDCDWDGKGTSFRRIGGYMKFVHHSSSFVDEQIVEGEIMWCPGLELAVGMQLKTFPDGLAGIRLICEGGEVIEIHSFSAGQWGEVLMCPPGSFIMKLEKRHFYRETFMLWWRAGNLRFGCKVGRYVKHDYHFEPDVVIEGDGFGLGKWDTDYNFVTYSGRFVCGMRAYTVDHVFTYDDDSEYLLQMIVKIQIPSCCEFV